MGLRTPYLYLNYAAAGRAEEVFARYGEEDVDRLKKIQAAFDPNNVFTANGLWREFMKLWEVSFTLEARPSFVDVSKVD